MPHFCPTNHGKPLHSLDVLKAMVCSPQEPIVITGIGLVAANGFGREAVWRAIRAGVSGIRPVESDGEFSGVLNLAAPVDISLEFPGQLKSIRLARFAAEEAIFDADIDFAAVDLSRFGCAVSGHFGDITYWRDQLQQAPRSRPFPVEQWLPNSACWNIAQRYGLRGPRFCHSTACASGLIGLLTAARSIRDGQCDIAIAGSGEAIDPLFAAGFSRMRVLAKGSDPEQGCLPFDHRRQGFVMGEGAGMFIIERLSHAMARNATIYAELVAGKMMADAHHVTSLDIDSLALERLIGDLLRKADVAPADVTYINAHGTGTQQNDLLETRGIRLAFGAHADDLCVSSLKSMLGHLVNASGPVELGLTVLGMRDGFAPPTLNLKEPDPSCDLDFVPMQGRSNRFQHAMKLSLAFGGHLVGAIIRRWNDASTGFRYPDGPIDSTRRAA